MTNRISIIRKSRALTQEKLAELLNVHFTTVNRLEKGKIALSLSWMERLSVVLDCQATDLISDNSSLGLIMVRGAAQAGHWATSSEWMEEDWYPVSVPLEDRYKKQPAFAVEVRGQSMNRRYREGTILICVRLIDLEEAPTADSRYLVERCASDGTQEITVKELRLGDDGEAWLWPDSDQPEFQAPLHLNGNEGDEIRLTAKVIGSYQPE